MGQSIKAVVKAGVSLRVPQRVKILPSFIATCCLLFSGKVFCSLKQPNGLVLTDQLEPGQTAWHYVNVLVALPNLANKNTGRPVQDIWISDKWWILFGVFFCFLRYSYTSNIFNTKKKTNKQTNLLSEFNLASCILIWQPCSLTTVRCPQRIIHEVTVPCLTLIGVEL